MHTVEHISGQNWLVAGPNKMLNAGDEDTLSFSVSFSVAGQPQREYENFCRAINYATKLLYKRRVSNMVAKGIGQVPERACSGHRKLLSKLWPGREITETLALYERLETELQETETEAGNRRREKQRLSGNCTRNAAGPKLSQHIQLQSFFLYFLFIVGLFMPIMTVKTLWSISYAEINVLINDFA